MRIALGLALDFAFICLFAAIGRRSHAETGALLAVATTAWPFLAGMAAGWLVWVGACARAPLRVRDGIPIWLAAVTSGMAFRHLNGAGTAVSFIVVATLFLGATLLGWRALAVFITSRRQSSGAQPGRTR